MGLILALKGLHPELCCAALAGLQHLCLPLGGLLMPRSLRVEAHRPVGSAHPTTCS